MGTGEAMNVLAAVSAPLIDEAKPAVTNSTGGISKGNSNASGGDAADNGEKPTVRCPASVYFWPF